MVASRSALEREKNPDRICLDRRGLTTFPWIVDEPKLRLISLQHNLISKIEKDHLAQLTKLVFLDLYDNQIDKFCNLDSLENLRVLLMGKYTLAEKFDVLLLLNIFFFSIIFVYFCIFLHIFVFYRFFPVLFYLNCNI